MQTKIRFPVKNHSGSPETGGVVTGALTVAAGLSADITVGNTVNLGLVADRTSTILIGCALGIAGLVGISLGVAAKAVARSMSVR